LVVFFEFLRRIGYCEAVRHHLPSSISARKLTLFGEFSPFLTA
jgi:hypothetical protein